MAKFIVDQTVRLVVDAETEDGAFGKASQWRYMVETRQFDADDEAAEVGEVVPVASDQFEPQLRELPPKELAACLRDAAAGAGD